MWNDRVKESPTNEFRRRKKRSKGGADRQVVVIQIRPLN